MEKMISLNANYPEEGEVFFIDKELNWTSFNVVKKIKVVLLNAYGLKKLKVGHAGTLDPLATGLVIVCTGRMTKKIELYQDMVKEYVTRIRLGATTPSFDLETEIDKTFPTEHISEKDVDKKVKEFIGEQDQVPPVFSAKFVDGKRAYTYARKGKSVELKPKRIKFYNIEVLNIDMPYVDLKIKCSKGTYIRAFARDFGQALGSGAHLTELRRTAIGDHRIENALSIKEFESRYRQPEE